MLTGITVCYKSISIWCTVLCDVANQKCMFVQSNSEAMAGLASLLLLACLAALCHGQSTDIKVVSNTVTHADFLSLYVRLRKLTRLAQSLDTMVPQTPVDWPWLACPLVAHTLPAVTGCAATRHGTTR